MHVSTRNFKKCLTLGLSRARKKRRVGAFLTPTAASLFWNIFRNNWASLISPLFATGSSPELKNERRVWAEDCLRAISGKRCLKYRLISHYFLISIAAIFAAHIHWICFNEKFASGEKSYKLEETGRWGLLWIKITTSLKMSKRSK